MEKMKKYFNYLIKILTVCLIPYFIMFIAYCISCIFSLSVNISSIFIYGFGIFFSSFMIIGIIASILCDYYFDEWSSWLNFIIDYCYDYLANKRKNKLLK